ncbi:ragulator complex protein LAMTOR5 homolog [Galendromus occidentalis]|uniref:Late endosomal/lysosomal adaptor and MAPK and MTOR activator 5 n=1 Tax=Galendromus occidentalis TaxID=34638 RepID=A0AAJ6QPW6_9ACAR|nr:ragulator complex protein LAMTOR5 homolog [Galendromus occidentalis]
MENSLIKSMEEASRQDGVVAVVCADNDGFPVQVRGKVPSQAAGVITQMCELAKQLDMRSTPTIQLETEKLNVFIQKKDMATVAVYKQKE